MYETILVPTDGSEEAKHAEDRALELADAFNATVHSLFVVEPVTTVEVGTERIREAMEEEGRRVVGEFEKRAESRGVTTVTDVRNGSPPRQIMDYAEENDADLIVMGTHGRTGVTRYVLGSVTERIVRMSDVPVLTVRKPDEESEE